jgi:hypothetical protein
MNAGQYPCPHCEGVFQVDTTTESGQVRCPHCQQVVQLPGAMGSSVSPSPRSSSPPGPQPVSLSDGVATPAESGGMLPKAIDGTSGKVAGDVQLPPKPVNSSGVSIKETVKTAGRGRSQVELTQRTPEERTTRRRRRNRRLWIVCLAIILGTLYLLL